MSDAEDVFQEVFVSLYTSKTVFAGEDHLKRWLVRATLNHCKNQRRFLARHPETPVDPLDRSGVIAVSDASEIREESGGDFDSDHELWEKVRQLPDQLSSVVVLYYVGGYATAEIADMLDVNPITVRTRLAKARKKLKAMLKEGNHGGK